MTGLCGVILAAGESTRMGRDKALLPWPKNSASSTLLSCAIRAFSDHCELVLVVGGKNAETIAPVIYAEGADLVRNPAPERGQFSSLQTGLHEVLNRGRDSAMVTLVDRPPPAAETLVELVGAFEQRSHEIWAVVPESGGRHGHPFLIGREMIEVFLNAPANANARDIEHAHQQHISYVPSGDSSVSMNVDTPQDYASLE
jgi:molybdenum cofactor cytidylyltransferase